MNKEYKSQVNIREARPRSKRLRELGGVNQGTGGSTVVNISSEGGGQIGETHTHANKPALDQISTDTDGYLYLNQLREVEVTDEVSGEVSTEWKQVPEKVKAGFADVANDLTEDSPVLKKFLSRLVADIAEGHITFAQGLKSLGLAVFGTGAHFGEFMAGLYNGTGAAIDEHGNAEVESMRVRTYFECMELIINRLTAIEGDQLLTEADTIESVDDLGNDCYGLHLREKWEGYFTAQVENNVLKGIINTLAQGSGLYYTSWMRVNSVNTASNYIEVTLYPGEDVPAGQNFPPCEMMKIARWGNQTDTSRQSCLYLSSTEGRIVKLINVTKPIIDKTNYGVVIGTLPDFLKEFIDEDGNPLPFREGLDYMYIPGIVTMDIIRLNRWTGKPEVTFVDRGQWVESGKYYCEAENPETEVFETSDVWYMGCKYRCCKNLTTKAPAWNTTDWAMIEGNPDFTVEFNDTDVLFDPDRFDLTLTIIARLHNIVITDDILDEDVMWTRYSEDADGVERVASDNAWAIKRAGAGKSIHLTKEDIDFNGYVPKVVKFTATVTLRDGMGEEAAQDSASFEYS